MHFLLREFHHLRNKLCYQDGDRLPPWKCWTNEDRGDSGPVNDQALRLDSAPLDAVAPESAFLTR